MKTSTHTFLVVFNANTEKFITKAAVLGELIKEHGQYGIAYIKTFDPVKEAFVRIKKETVKSICSFNTETMVQLEKVKY